MLACVRLASVTVFVLVSAVVGLRLLGLARRTGRLPELTMGLSFLLSGCVGYSLMILASLAAEPLGPTRSVVSGTGELFVALGCTCLYVFVWQTFRPDRAWSGALFALGTGAALGAPLIESMVTGMARDLDGTWMWVALAGRATPYVWGCAETGLYHRLMRRRVALGLAAPRDALRFLLWTAAFGASAMIYALAAARVLLAHHVPIPDWLFDLGVSVLGLASAGCIWVAFFGRGLGAAAQRTAAADGR